MSSNKPVDREAALRRVVSAIRTSPSDYQLAFDTILEHATEQCGASYGAFLLCEADELELITDCAGGGVEPELMRVASTAGDCLYAGALATGHTAQSVDVLAALNDHGVSAECAGGFEQQGLRSLVCVPLPGAEAPIGVLVVYRPEVGNLDDHRVEFLETLAEHAALAVSNAHSFRAAQQAQAQQSALAEILRLISQSRADTQPVFDAILEHATQLCDAHFGGLMLVKDGMLEFAAVRNANPQFADFLRKNPLPLDSRLSISAKAAVERCTQQVVDREKSEFARTGQAHGEYASQLEAMRTQLAVPMLSGDECIGVICIYRRVVAEFDSSQIELLSLFAEQAVIAIENGRQFEAVKARTDEAEEALKRQVATSDILRVISQSPTDARPVFEAILDKAASLCGASNGHLLMRDGDVVRQVASLRATTSFDQYLASNPADINGVSMVAQSVRECEVVQIEDLRETDLYRQGHPLRVATVDLEGTRSQLCVPLRKGGQAIGTIVIYRHEVRRFDSADIELLSTFADQAVIAVENVRLFETIQARTDEAQEALKRQTATSDVLRVISQSPTDASPVFEAILEKAASLCGASNGHLLLRAGETLHLAASLGASEAFVSYLAANPIALEESATSSIAQSVLAVEVGQTEDLRAKNAQPQMRSSRAAIVDAEGVRTQLCVPLHKGGEAIGVLVIYRREVRLFADADIDLVSTFADQAVIAVENVRLFETIQARTDEAQEALKRQTATSDVLRVISQSPTDTGPVFETILKKAASLCGASNGNLLLRTGEKLHLAASLGGSEAWVNYLAANPIALEESATSTAARSALAVEVIQTEDLRAKNVHADMPSSRTAIANAEGVRTQLCVPLHKGAEAIGLLMFYRKEVRLFSDADIELVSTFADQAVIAIENARLFETSEARTREVQEALERQTATSDILRVISESPTNSQSVFDAIVAKAAQSCGASIAVLVLVRDNHLQLVASLGTTDEYVSHYTKHPVPLDSQYTSALAVSENRIIHIEDLADSEFLKRGDVHDANRVAAIDIQGIRTQLCVPLRAGEDVIGLLVLIRQEKRLFRDEDVALVSTFADQAVIAIENARQFETIQARTEEVQEALERQTATSEILRVISESPTDSRPVFDAILEKAARLCGASHGLLVLRSGDVLQLMASLGMSESGREYVIANPVSLNGPSTMAPVVRDAKVVQIEDLSVSGLPGAGSAMRAVSVGTEGMRTQLGVPLRKGSGAIGAIVLYRREVQLFADDDIELVSTFADQAVIAIENARLFETSEARTREVQESLERQTATSEILRVISESPTDSQPVFEAILDRAARLCGASQGVLFLRDGDDLIGAAMLGVSEALRDYIAKNPIGHDTQSTVARCVRSAKVLHVEDLRAKDLPGAEREMRTVAVDAEGMRTQLLVPLCKGSEAIGAIVLFRQEVRLFADADVELVSTFADQAVIAIENVRLFENSEARTLEVQHALERQTATSEILRVISESPTDSQPVFNAILEKAARLCGASHGGLVLRQGDVLPLAASLGMSESARDFLIANPIEFDGTSTVALAVRDAKVTQTEDMRDSGLPGHSSALRALAIDAEGMRTQLCVPLRKGTEVIGAILLYRREVQLFADEDIELLSTFADQAVIAIENVRLFQTLQTRTGDLSRSVSELEALSEIGQVVSSTLDIDTVLETIVNQAVALSDAGGGLIAEYDEKAGTLPIRAGQGYATLLSGMDPVQVGQGVMGRAVADRKPVQVPDVDAPGAYTGPLRPILKEAGLKALLALPLLREERVLGALMVGRSTRGEFDVPTVELLETFAAQSALAIDNARVYQALEAQGQALDAANRHKSEFLANMSHELRTPLNAVIGFSEVLGDELFGELNEKQAEYVHDIHDSGRHLLSLINDILDLSKIEAGHMELDVSRFDLRGAIDVALTLVGERATRRQLTLESEVDENLGEFTGDERKFKQILLNLLSNAIKFTPEGGRVKLVARDVGAHIEVAVHDTGVGMTEDEQSLVFEAFRQVGTDYARKGEGTGLGLTLTRQFVELHGGEVTVTSSPGNGSVFRVILPHEPDGSITEQ